MQFVRHPRLVDVAERVLPEVVAYWESTLNVQNISTGFLRKLQVSMLKSRVFGRLTSVMLDWHSLTNFWQQAWAMQDLSNHHLFKTIPDPFSQLRVTLSLEFIITIPSQATSSNVNIPKCTHTVPSVLCYASSALLAAGAGYRICLTWLKAHDQGVGLVLVRILRITR